MTDQRTLVAFERAKAVGIDVLGVSNAPDCYGVRVDAASFDRAVERLEQAEARLRKAERLIAAVDETYLDAARDALEVAALYRSTWPDNSPPRQGG